MQSFRPNYKNGQDHLEQWDRICRWYEKVKAIESKQYDRILTADEQEDFLLAFFFNALILKDWIKKIKSDTGIEKLFNKPTGKQSLMTLIDFVTNYKHFDNSLRPRLDKDTYLVSRHAISGTNGPTHTWFIESNGLKIDLYKLADDVHSDLQQYLELQNYIA